MPIVVRLWSLQGWKRPDTPPSEKIHWHPGGSRRIWGAPGRGRAPDVDWKDSKNESGIIEGCYRRLLRLEWRCRDHFSHPPRPQWRSKDRNRLQVILEALVNEKIDDSLNSVEFKSRLLQKNWRSNNVPPARHEEKGDHAGNPIIHCFGVNDWQERNREGSGNQVEEERLTP